MRKQNSLVAKKYNQQAVEYDTMSRTASPWVFFDKPFITKVVIPAVKKKTVILDLGCGAGKVMELFINNGIPAKNIYGVDISKGLISIAKKNIPEAQFRIGDFTKVKLPRAHFNIAISVRSVEYLNQKDLEKFFINVYQALKKDGKLFLITGHPLRVNNGPMETYLERSSRKVSLPWGMKVCLYHKTVSDLVMGAITAGFLIEYMDEPPIPLSLKRKNPKQFVIYKSYGATNFHMILKKNQYHK